MRCFVVKPASGDLDTNVTVPECTPTSLCSVILAEYSLEQSEESRIFVKRALNSIPGCLTF